MIKITDDELARLEELCDRNNVTPTNQASYDDCLDARQELNKTMGDFLPRLIAELRAVRELNGIAKDIVKYYDEYGESRIVSELCKNFREALKEADDEKD